MSDSSERRQAILEEAARLGIDSSSFDSLDDLAQEVRRIQDTLPALGKWGTERAPYSQASGRWAKDNSSWEGGESIFTGADGRQYGRTGSSPEEDAQNPDSARFFKQSDWAYDPRYGWGIELGAAERFSEQSEDVFSKYGPLLALGGIAGVAAPALMGAAGATGGGGATATAGTIGGGTGSFAAADAAGLAQMAADAGLTGSAAADFVASGGTLGSTAAGGGSLADLAAQYGTNGSAPTIDPFEVDQAGLGTGTSAGDTAGANLAGAQASADATAATNAARQAATGTAAAGTGAVGAATGTASTAGLIERILNGTATAADLAGLGSSALSLYNASQARGNASDAAARADPFASQRPQYQASLANLMSNPGSQDTSPYYKYLMDTQMNQVNASNAAGGFRNSGRGLMALQDRAAGVASQSYFPQANLLAQLSGANAGSPGTSASLMQGGQQQSQNYQADALAGLLSIFGKRPAQSTSAYGMPYTSNNSGANQDAYYGD